MGANEPVDCDDLEIQYLNSLFRYFNRLHLFFVSHMYRKSEIYLDCTNLLMHTISPVL